MKIDIDENKGHIYLKEGEHIFVGIDIELSIAIICIEGKLVCTAPMNSLGKTFKVTRDGIKEEKINGKIE